jgi:fructokinase
MSPNVSVPRRLAMAPSFPEHATPAWRGPYREGVIAVCGELVADLIVRADGTLLPVPGGSPANTALAAARLGLPVQFLGRFGDDVFGEAAWSRLRDAGVDLTGSVSARERSTLAVATTDADGHARYVFWTQGTADWQWTDAELASAPAPATRAVHTASVASWTPPGAAAILGLLTRARAAGLLVSYDPNVRPALLGGESRAIISAMVSQAGLVKVSDEDLAALHPGQPPLTTARQWLALGPAAIVVTAGAEGATVLRADRPPLTVSAPPAHVVDTIGAGDTFTAGLLAALLGAVGDAPDASALLRQMDDEQWTRALRTAATAAAITCSRAGCNPPTRDELEAALATAG